MKKELLVGSVAVVAALSSVIALGTTSFADAANTSLKTTTTKTHTISKKGMHEGMKGDFKGGDRGGDKGFGGFGGGEHMMFGGDEATKTAIKNNDYNAFVTAWNADTKKPANATVPTQAEFTKMVARYTKQVAVEAAIESNDYNAYVNATKPTQEEFNDIVARHTTQKAIQAAITANDYNAFVTAWNADTKKPANATVPTQAEFTKMVTRATKKAINTTSTNQ